MDSSPADDRRHVSVTKFPSLWHTHRQAYITHVCKCDLHWSDPLRSAAIDNWPQESITRSTVTQLPLPQYNHVSVHFLPTLHINIARVVPWAKPNLVWLTGRSPPAGPWVWNTPPAPLRFGVFDRRNIVKSATCYTKVCPSVCLSVTLVSHV